MIKPWKLFVSTIILVGVAWAALFILMHSRTCCVCGESYFVPQLPASHYEYPFYCADCIIEIN